MFDNGEQVTWHRFIPGPQDPYGHPLPGGFVDTLVENVAFAPTSVDETTPNQHTVLSAQLVLQGQTISYGPRDQFTVRGQRFAVDGTNTGGDGQVNAWRSPFSGALFGQIINLKRDEEG